MLNLDQIKEADTEELESLLTFFRRDIQHAESWLQELRYAERTLKIVLCLKVDSLPEPRKDRGEKVTALKKQLLKCGLKQKTLAERLKISRAAVSLQVKTGIHMAKVATKYAEALNCDPRSLLDF
ncbi:MAG: helix-turn-helix transcriptional regulator [Victivallaceae bacterium]|nr:helix-turn-helix transcriptional regulator [Victivallaceae bacterium]